MAFGIALAPLATTAASGFSFGAAMTAFSIGSTILGTFSRIQQSNAYMKNLRTAAEYDKQKLAYQAKQQQIQVNKREKMLLSEKRAAFTASGVQFTGSPLLVMQNTIEEADDARFWAEKNLEISLLETDAELAGALAAESFKKGQTLIYGAANIAATSYFGEFPTFGNTKTLGDLDPITQLSGDAYLKARPLVRGTR